LEQQGVTELLEEAEQQPDQLVLNQQGVTGLLEVELRQVRLVKCYLLQEEQYLQLQAAL
jgi:hypothetical protein